ncbi:MAG: DNA translocase FtsK [Lachnospiraceae bacterium]|nr:DNA translocase FtsK [Lachnospiraceae bacterium]
MATAKKRTTRSSSAKKRTQTKKNQSPSGVRLEIILCIVLAVSVLLLISNFGIGGVVGNLISSFFFGLFGLMTYVFPFILFLGFSFYVANKNNPLVIRKIIGASLLFLFLCTLLQLISEGYIEGLPFGDYYTISAEDKVGGGLLGGALSKLLCMAFGLVGAYIITVIGCIIGAIVMTQRTLLANLHSKGSMAYQEAKKERQVRKAEQARLEKEAVKQEKQNKLKEKEKKVEAFVIPQLQIQRDEPESKKERSEQIAAPLPQLKPVESVQEIPEEPAKADHTGERITKNPKSTKEEIASGIQNIKKEIDTKQEEPKKQYQFPPLSLLKAGRGQTGDSDAHLRETAAKLQKTFHDFGVNVTVTNASCGPTVTRYELQPEQGVKVSRIVGLSDDIKLNLAAADIRIEAPIPGKAAVGIEVPNENNSAVMLRDLLQSEDFQKSKAALSFAVGKDIAGKPVVTDIAKMPHLLIAGATGSGKSVCINTLIMSLLYKANPDDVKMIMIDPKVVELSCYNGIPHLFIPVVTDPKKAAGALNWAVAEMTDRYNKFSEYGVRDLKGFNEKITLISQDPALEDKPKKMPQIVIIVDELADLMMVAPGEVEDAICRLAQLARAAGIHLIIATQRPSVNVITGLIKANMPSRIAFSVSSGVDSRTILDMNGAEKLLGKGDMLFYPQGYPKPARLQGSFVSDQEVSSVVKFLSSQHGEVVYNTEVEEKINSTVSSAGSAASGGGASDLDVYFTEAGKFIIDKDKASIGMLQRVFKIGFNRAARIMDQLAEAGVVGEEEGTKPRKVLMSMEEFEQYVEESV